MNIKKYGSFMSENLLVLAIVWVQIQKFMGRFREGLLKFAPTDITFLSFNREKGGRRANSLINYITA